jgi:hypothetical protein
VTAEKFVGAIDPAAVSLHNIKKRVCTMSFTKKITCFLGVLLLLLAVSWYLLSSMEISDISFSSYADAQPAIQAGWLPKWLPKSAYEINESHDIDSNISWTRFRFLISEKFQESVCSSVDKRSVRFPDVRYINRFPVFVRDMYRDLTANTNLQFYDCSESHCERYLAISVNEKNNLAYSWAIPKDDQPVGVVK